MSTPLRILMLHGYTRSATAFSRQTGALRRSLKSIAQLDYIDGTREVNTETAEALAAAEGEQAVERTLGWWDKDEETNEYRGGDVTLERLADLLASADPPYDGILGFSQGAALATLLAGLVQTPSANAAFERGSKNRTIRPLKFVIVVGGFASVDPAHKPIFAKPIEVPSLHVLGKTDFIVDEARSRTAIEVFSPETRRVEYHPSGHHVPSDANWRRFFADWIGSFSQGSSSHDVASPSSLQSSL